jgi:hypothetical protein
MCTLESRDASAGSNLAKLVMDANPGAGPQQLLGLIAKAREINGLQDDKLAKAGPVLIPRSEDPKVSTHAPEGRTGLTSTDRYGQAQTGAGEASGSRIPLMREGSKPVGKGAFFRQKETGKKAQAALQEQQEATSDSLFGKNLYDLTNTLSAMSPEQAGAFFGQAPRRQLASYLNDLGKASAEDRRTFLPGLLDALARSRPPADLPRLLPSVDSTALRGLAKGVKDPVSAQIFVDSGLLQELVRRSASGGDHGREANAAIEVLSRLKPEALARTLEDPKLSAAGLGREGLMRLAREAAENRDVFQSPPIERLAENLAAMPGKGGMAAAVELTATAIAAQEKGVEAGERSSSAKSWQQGLEELLQKSQCLPETEKAAVIKAMVDSSLFGHPNGLTEGIRESFPKVLGSASKEFVDLYVQNATDFQMSDTEVGALSTMVKALAFSGPEAQREHFTAMWGNLMGATLNRAMADRSSPDESLAEYSGQLFSAYLRGAKTAQTDYEHAVKGVETMLSAATSGVLGGFSWRALEKFGEETRKEGEKGIQFNFMSPLKEHAKESARGLAAWLVGKDPEGKKAAAKLLDELLKEGGRTFTTKEDGSPVDDLEAAKRNFGEIRRAVRSGATDVLR